MPKQALILGSRGFIGSSVASRFVADGKLKVISMGSADVDLCDTDVAAPILTQNMKDAVVVFCAGRHRQRGDTHDIMLQNLAMVQSIIKAAEQQKPEHIIFLSSVEVYGLPKVMPITEQTPLEPHFLYAVGKVTCEMMLQCYAEKANVPLTILRLPGIYGPGDDGISIISKLIQTSRGEANFKLFGNGQDLRDYVFVEDLADLILCLAQDGVGQGVLNVATGHSLSVLDLIKAVREHFGAFDVDSVTAVASSNFDLIFDTSNLIKSVPDFQFSSISDGFSKYENT
ncbi:MAG: NAD(P)-dependent oxidoreductase [Mariprofundaceae bacterium]|nr:NAD(P)-dependent oxidoreductase [Mariprofundaceae bacterium]